MIGTPETFAMLEELCDICERRGYDLALTEALGDEQRQVLSALDTINDAIAMNNRILCVLQEHQEALLACGGSAAGLPEGDWSRFLAAWGAYKTRCAETSTRAARVSRLYYRLLRKLVPLARQGVI